MLAHFETLSTTATISQLELLTRRRRVTPRAPRTYHPHMSNGDLHWIANYIWGIADDVLRDLYVRGKYRDVILPMTVLRRLDAVLVDSKPNVLEMKAVLDQAGVVAQDAALRQAAGQAFYNTSKFTLRDPPGPREPAAAQGRLRGLPRRLLAQRTGHSRELRVP